MDVTMRGRWYERDGNMYSNLSWLPSNSYKGSACTSYVQPTHNPIEDTRPERPLPGIDRRLGRSISDWIDEWEQSHTTGINLPGWDETPE